jgi:hypothetical protein
MVDKVVTALYLVVQGVEVLHGELDDRKGEDWGERQEMIR